MFIDQSFTKNKAVINWKTVQIYGWVSRLKFTISKIHPLRDAAFGADFLTPLRILKIITVGPKKWILVMLLKIVTCCKNFQILICSPVKRKFLHLLSKFCGYIFNGLGKR